MRDLLGRGSSTRWTGRCRVRGLKTRARADCCRLPDHATLRSAMLITNPNDRGPRGGLPARGAAVPGRPAPRRPRRLPLADHGLGLSGESSRATRGWVPPFRGSLPRRALTPPRPKLAHNRRRRRSLPTRTPRQRQRRPLLRPSSSLSGTPPTAPAARTRWRRSTCAQTASCTTAPPASPRRRASPSSTSLVGGRSRTRRRPPRASPGMVCWKIHG